MRKIILALFPLSTLVNGCSILEREDDFYKKECIYHLYKDSYENHCKPIWLKTMEGGDKDKAVKKEEPAKQKESPKEQELAPKPKQELKAEKEKPEKEKDVKNTEPLELEEKKAEWPPHVPAEQLDHYNALITKYSSCPDCNGN